MLVFRADRRRAPTWPRQRGTRGPLPDRPCPSRQWGRSHSMRSCPEWHRRIWVAARLALSVLTCTASRAASRANRSSTGICRSWRVPSRQCPLPFPAMSGPAWSNRQPVSPSQPCPLVRNRESRSRAAIRAHRTALEAESWMQAAAAAGGAVRFRQAQQFSQHVQHRGLDLGARGTRRPEHTLHPETGGQQFA